MAVKAGTAYVDIEGDFSGLNRQVSSHFRGLTKDAGGAGRKVGRALGVGMVAGVGAAVVAGKQLFDFGKESVNVASDINESLSKNTVLFGKYAKGIETFSKRSANAFGISRQSALEYTGTFGNLFNALGISNKESAKFSTGLVKLSADMASFNNSTPEEALEAIRSGLVGETEPLRRFGVNMNDATLKAQAMRMGLIKNTKEALTPQTKALAAQALITKQTSAAHGDFARTSDQLANRQRRLQARWSDMKAELGTALLPAVNNVSGALLDFADKVQPKVERSIRRITEIFGRKDLDFGEKLRRSWDVLDRQFGPMVDGMVQKVRDANLDDKLGELIRDASPKIAEGLKDVGVAGAKALWTGFREAPLWAQVLGAGFVAKAIFGGTGGGGSGSLASSRGPFGLAGALAAKGFKTAFEAGAIRLSTLSGALGKVATIFTARGSTPANPIFVKDIAFGVPGGKPGVPPVIAPGGRGGPRAPVPVPPKSLITKIRPVLAGVGKLGAAGAALALGINLIDSKGDPIRAVVNTASDLTFGILPRMKSPEEIAGGKAKEITAKIPVDIRPQVTPEAEARIATLIADIDKRTADIASRKKPVLIPRVGIRPLSAEELAKRAGLTGADQAQIAKNATELGKLVATSFTTGLRQQQKYFDVGHLTSRLKQQLEGPLKNMPKEAHQAAVDTMVEFARGLERQGRLPKGATADMVRDIKRTTGLLPSWMKSVTKRGVDSMNNQLKRRDLVDSAKRQYEDLKKTWGAIPGMAKFTGQNTARNYNTQIEFLRNKVKTSTGKMKEDARRDLKAVQEDAKKYGKGANTGLNAQLKDMGIKGSKKARKLRDDVKQAVRNMATGVGTHSGTASQSLFDSLQNMTGNAKAVLKALGLKPPPYVLKTPPAPKDAGRWGMHQRGAYVSGGKPSGDSVPILAERGEYVLNREAVKMVGKKRLDELNYRNAPRFQGGGMVRVPGDPNLTGGRDLVNASVRDLASYLVRRFKLEIGYAYDPGGGHKSPGHNVTGTALDVVPNLGAGGSWSSVGDAVGWATGQGMTVYYDGSRGSTPLEDHGPGNHAHFELRAGVKGFPAFERIPIPEITGPAGMTLDIMRTQVNRVGRAINNYLANKYASVTGGPEGTEIPVGGFNKSQLAALWIKAGGNPGVANIMAAIALAESGGDPDIEGPLTSYGFRAKGLWQIHPPEPDSGNPLANARQAVAKYNASGFAPWEAYTNGSYRNFLQRGGLVGMQTGGGIKRISQFFRRKDAATAAPPKVVNKWFEKLKHPKHSKPKKHITLKALDKLGKTGAYGVSLANRMQELSDNVDQYADWAQRANDITDTDALQAALNAELTLRGGTSSMSDADLLKLFPAADQDVFIQQWLQNNASINGGTQLHWLNQELGSLLAWRNTLIDNLAPESGIRKSLVNARNAYKKVKAELKRVAADIARYLRLREQAVERRNNHRAAIRDLRKQLENERDKKKPSAKKINDLRDKIGDRSKKENEAEDDIRVYDRRLNILRGVRERAQRQARVLGGDLGGPGDTGLGENGRIFKIKDAIDAMEPNLTEIHGIEHNHGEVH